MPGDIVSARNEETDQEDRSFCATNGNSGEHNRDVESRMSQFSTEEFTVMEVKQKSKVLQTLHKIWISLMFEFFAPFVNWYLFKKVEPHIQDRYKKYVSLIKVVVIAGSIITIIPIWSILAIYASYQNGTPIPNKELESQI